MIKLPNDTDEVVSFSDCLAEAVTMIRYDLCIAAERTTAKRFQDLQTLDTGADHLTAPFNCSDKLVTVNIRYTAVHEVIYSYIILSGALGLIISIVNISFHMTASKHSKLG